MRIGWWSLLLFLTLGIVLEAMHGLKVGWYLNVANETRRLMWTLAHAHGALLGLINLAFAFSVRLFADAPPHRWRSPASYCLIAATVLLPGGFFLGGISVYSGDPGPGVLLVPAGAAFLLIAVLLVAVRSFRWAG